MKIDHHQKRLNAIKLKYVFFPKKCMICREEYRKERMYRVDRWIVNQRVLECWYCQHCIHSKEELLNKIDTDYGCGIAFVDEWPNYKEKRMPKIPRGEPWRV